MRPVANGIAAFNYEFQWSGTHTVNGLDGNSVSDVYFVIANGSPEMKRLTISQTPFAGLGDFVSVYVGYA